jgi:alpha-tubulin suppressor-like RCC1 family protein
MNNARFATPVMLAAVTAALAIVLLLQLDFQAPPQAQATGGDTIGSGEEHTCAVVLDGAAKCWGSNGSGRIGDNYACDYPCNSPFDVAGLNSGVLQMSGGESHTCAVMQSGAMKCWGWNTNGQLGNGEAGIDLEEPVPVDVIDLGGNAVQVDAGDGHTCARMSDGTIKCWGKDDYGQLGDPNRTEYHTPFLVPGISDAIDVAAGGNQTCAIIDPTPKERDSGGLKCWGSNFYGELGINANGSGTSSNSPVDVLGLGSGVVDVSAGDFHTCAVLDTGVVKCWGLNRFGQVGKQSTDTCAAEPCSDSAVDTAGITNAVAIAAGGEQTCALTAGGGVKCWGTNYRGQLGNGEGGTVDDLSANPVDVVGLASGATAIVTDGNYRSGHACALLSNGNLKCWGENYRGQLGDGTGFNVGDFSTVPVDVIDLKLPPVTPTPELTPTNTPPPPTATPTAMLANGDASCNGVTDAIDSALVLQFGAGLLSALPCPAAADVNEDGSTNSLDAALILQFVAGFIPSLPV